MPVTPFHLGPGLVCKAIRPQTFSLATFTVVQCVIDVESVWNILRGNWPVHGPLHTGVGALAVALAVAAVTLFGRRRLAALAERARGRLPPGWWRETLAPPTPAAVVVGALGGAVLHVVPDAIMHPDLAPLAPWSRHNPLLVEHGFELGHLVCFLLGVVGFLGWRRSRQRLLHNG
jgi:hypothetical protein